MYQAETWDIAKHALDGILGVERGWVCAKLIPGRWESLILPGLRCEREKRLSVQDMGTNTPAEASDSWMLRHSQMRDPIVHTEDAIRSCWGSSQEMIKYERVFSEVLIVSGLCFSKRKALRTVR